MNDLQLKIEALKEKIVPGYSKSIDVDEGWYQIVIDCDADLTAIDPDYQIFQVKQKFGSLRFYFYTKKLEKSQEMFELIKDYEVKSLQTCEATGKPGVLMKSKTGWFRTLNPEYAISLTNTSTYTICAKGW